MKNILVVLLIIVSFISCSLNNTIIDTRGEEVTIPYYGLFNKTSKLPNVEYEVSARNVVIGALLCTTVVVPIIVIGWRLFKPIGFNSSS